jgi:ATP-binding cassette, subfamily B, bacterial MsbA
VSVFKRILGFTRQYWTSQFVTFLCAAGEIGAYLMLPFIYKMLIDDALTTGNSDNFVRVIVYYFLIIVCIVTFGFFKELLYKTIDEKVIKDIRLNLYMHLKESKISDLLEHKTGNIMSYFINDIPQMANGLTYNVIQAIQYVIRIVFGIAILASIDFKLLLIIIALLPFYLFSAKLFSKPIKHSAQKQQHQNGIISETLQENISAATEILVFNRKGWDFDRITKVFAEYVNLSVRNMLLMKLSGDIGFIIYWLATILVYFVGGTYVLKGMITIGTLLLYAHYLDNIYMPSNLILNIYNNIQKMIASGERYFELIGKVSSEQKSSSNSGHIIQEFKGTIELRKVCFSYADKEVIKNLSMEIKKGEAVAIVGPSGAGKSTIIKLILGLLEPSTGEILIDKVSLADANSESLYSTLGVVSQDPFLFGDSIYNNLIFGKLDASFEEVQRAAKLACADDFIEAMKEGYHTILGERGSKLSGGQRQRISIARTILKNPEIIIFDEVTSALDSESEKDIFKTIDLLRKDGKTIILITHSLKNIQNMDKIVVVSDGEVEAVGSHNELLLGCKLYQELYSTGEI